MSRNHYFFIATLLLLVISCKSDTTVKTDHHFFTGSTMGTTYNVTYESSDYTPYSLKRILNLELKILNDGLSTYQEDAVISMFNEYGDITLDTNDVAQLHFYRVYKAAKKMYDLSDGDFDPTVMPLVNHWGFGYEKKDRSAASLNKNIDSIRAIVSMTLVDEFEMNDRIVISKKRNATELDFSAIAKGYAVDIIAKKLLDMGITNFLVDIGGELVAHGKNKKNKFWTVGINRPVENVAVNQADIFVQLDHVAMASSGNYRNFYEVDGKKYSHTINPKTGYPERSNLLGVSVITKDCMTADALSTSCMVKGLAKAKTFIEQIPDAEACFIYNQNDSLMTAYSSGFSQYLTLIN